MGSFVVWQVSIPAFAQVSVMPKSAAPVQEAPANQLTNEAPHSSRQNQNSSSADGIPHCEESTFALWAKQAFLARTRFGPNPILNEWNDRLCHAQSRPLRSGYNERCSD